MPELPEVEVAARNLRRWLAKKTIVRVEIPKSRVIRGGSASMLVAWLEGARVTSVERRGKWLRLRLPDGWLYSHLGMTGKWVKRPTRAPAEPWERARLDTASSSVRYTDPRLFGRLFFAQGDAPEWRALGPDPLGEGLDPGRLHQRLARIRRSIKETLLDQALFAGVGNIQAQEALWRAKLDPRRAAHSLSRAEVARLVAAIEASIAYTLADEEGPEITYVEEGGENPFKVYAKSGQACPRCKTRLRSLVQGGRSTVYCPRCQRAKRS